EGGARGRGGRGNAAPMPDAEKAEIAKLSELPPWKPGAGDGDYRIGPDYPAAPEQTPRADVPKGRVATFSLPLAESKFYTGAGMRGAKAARDITVYVPAQYVAGTILPFIVTADAYGAGRNQLP